MPKTTGARPPGRPRSEATHLAILVAAADLLERESYARISIERIAAEAKVGKQSIYRWWASKADVLLEAYTERALRRIPAFEATGDAFADLESLMRRFFAATRAPAIGRTIRSLIAEAQLDPEFRAKFHGVFVSARRAMMRKAVEAGIASGQFRRDLDVELVLDLLYGAFWYRLLSGTPDPIDDAFAREIVAMLRPCLVHVAATGEQSVGDQPLGRTSGTGA
jgi:AcrR family transcriptional regulator